nr:zinc finger, CCHC-type [Tanacetum cinerariifolium]
AVTTTPRGKVVLKSRCDVDMVVRLYNLKGTAQGTLLFRDCEGISQALEVLPADMEAEAKAELNKKAHSVVILCLANIEVKFKDEDLALLLLTSLPASYEHFVDTLLNGQEALTLEDVKEIKEMSKANGDDGEGLYVRGRTDRRDSRQSKGKSRSKYRDWIMDSGGSYHMTLKLDLFFDFLESDGGRVLLGDNRECKIRGIGMFKHEAFIKFKKWKQLVENHTGRTVKKLRMDNGLDREFEELCIESGIARHLTVAGTPQ